MSLSLLWALGVESYDIDMKEQKVTVKGTVPAETVFQTVSKTGKKTAYWEDAPEAKPEAEAEAKPEETVATAWFVFSHLVLCESRSVEALSPIFYPCVVF